MIRVLFVCLGNICRSPMAEAVFRDLVTKEGIVDQFDIASAGTGGWHAGERPHRGTLQILQKHNIDVGNKRARQLTHLDMNSYDYILAMDSENVADIQALFGRRTRRLMDFAPEDYPEDVPDPYYTGAFDEVFRLIETGSKGLLAHIREKEGV